MNELLERLDSKYSHQAIWNEYVELIEMLLKQGANKASDDEETNPLSRTVMTSDFSGRLVRISAATSKLQAVLNADEREILHLLNFEWIRLYWGQLMQR